MNMTDMLVQMTIQSTWQVPQVSQSGQTSGTQDKQETSFQDLLDQRREEMTQNETTQGTGTDKGEDVEHTQPNAKPDQDQDDQMEAVAVAATGLLGNLTAVPANFVEQTGSAETGVVQTVTIEAVVPDVQTTPQMTVQGQGQTQQEAPQVQTAVQQTQTAQPAVQDNTQGQQAQVSQPQVAATNTEQPQSQGQEDLSQDLNQSADTQTAGNEMTDVTVESFQTPLFREVEATPVRVGDGETVDMTAPTQEVEKSLSSILKGALDQGDQHVEIKLNPANLGSVTAEFTRTPEGVLHVVLHAETEQTAKLLSDHAANLGMLLQDGNRGEVRVQVAQPQENQSAWQQPDQEGGRQQQHSQQQQRNTPRQEAETFLHQLRLGLVERATDAV